MINILGSGIINSAVNLMTSLFPNTPDKPGGVFNSLGELSSFMYIYKGILGVSSGMAVVACALCFIKMMMTTDTREAGKYKQDIKEVILAWVIINMLGAIILTATSMIGNIQY